MMTASELKGWQKACENRIEECFVIAEKQFGKKIPRPAIVWSAQQQKTAGVATHSRFGGTPIRIKLSLQILALNGQEFCDRAPGHEAAHLIQAYIDGHSDGHGPRWKSVMRLLGQSAERCHSMTTMSSADCRQFSCDCAGFVHKIGRNKKATLRGISYGTVSCRKCKSKLVEIVDAKIDHEQFLKARAAKAAIRAVQSGRPVATVAPKATAKKAVVKVAKPLPKKVAKKVAKAPAKKAVVPGTIKFADVVREVLDANPKKSYEEIVQILAKIEPSVAKCRCYARDFMIKRGTYKN